MSPVSNVSYLHMAQHVFTHIQITFYFNQITRDSCIGRCLWWLSKWSTVEEYWILKMQTVLFVS